MTSRIPQPLDLAVTPTPIEYLHRLTQHAAGPEIWVKRDDMTGSTLSGNKVRKLEYALAEALGQGAKVIVTVGGVQSNHCRATALLCARLGLKCHLILRGAAQDVPDGNLLLDTLAGAEISFFPEEIYSTQRHAITDRLIDEYAAKGTPAYYIPVGASNAVGSLGYVRAYEEIMGQQVAIDHTFDHIIVAVGSGGTLAGLIAGRALAGDAVAPKIWGINVCQTAEEFTREIREHIAEMNEKYGFECTEDETPIHILDGYVGPGYAQPYPEMIDTIRLAARLEGLVLDPVYTGKAFYGMLEHIKFGTFKAGEKVLFIHTGGIYGLFPQRNAFFM